MENLLKNTSSVKERMQPKEHIENISKEFLSTPARAMATISGAIDRLGKAFSRRGHFVMEFIQNADDAGAEQVMFDMSNNMIKISNSGKPFAEKDVDSICSVGQSSKPIEDYIGYLGVGFKSVYLISNAPEIHSDSYHFKFDKDHWGSEGKLPWQVMPIWLNETQEQRWNTVFAIPLKHAEIAGTIRGEITRESLDRRILLFLRNLSEIIIRDGEEQVRDIIKREVGQNLYELEERGKGSLLQEKWLVFRKKCDVPPEVSEDYVTQEWERGNVKKREVIVAFKLNEENELEGVEGTAHVGVFSFLPLKEEKSVGLNFNFQADFLTAPGREVITRETKWNQWLAHEIYDVIIKICIPAFLRDENWKYTFTDVLRPGIGGHELFDRYIKHPLTEYMANNPILIAADGSLVKTEDAISLGREVKELLSDEDIELLYPNKKILHENCKSGMQVMEGPETVSDFVKNSQTLKLREQKAQEGNIRWFKTLYQNLSPENKDELHASDFILTTTNELVRPGEVYINPEGLTIPQGMEGNFKIVHPGLIDVKESKDLLLQLGVSELTDEHIQSILTTREIPGISGKWQDYSEEERMEKIKVCKKLWDERKIEAKDVSFLTLKTKDGEWLPPKELVFSKEYDPPHKLEELSETGLMDIAMKFLTPDFLNNGNDVWRWKSFFKELGVDEILSENSPKKNNIIQRIAIKKVLNFEANRGRTARELGESEQLGYDIESKVESEVRNIEVKGGNDLRPDILLSSNEFRVLNDKKDTYFVYVVGNALSVPRLYMIKGSRLLEIIPKVIITPKQWRSLVEEEA